MGGESENISSCTDMFRHLVWKVNGKSEIKIYQKKAISAHVCFVWAKTYNCIPLVWVSIHCGLKMEKQICKLGKVDDRTPVLQLARSKSKRQNESDVERLF